jgi:3-oxoacid CoA-transferase subunit A
MQIHTPGIFVQRVIHVPDSEKRIERRTVANVPSPSETGGVA